MVHLSILSQPLKFLRLVPNWASKEQFLGDKIIWVWFPGSSLPHPDIDQWKHTMVTNHTYIVGVLACQILQVIYKKSHNRFRILFQCLWQIDTP